MSIIHRTLRRGSALLSLAAVAACGGGSTPAPARDEADTTPRSAHAQAQGAGQGAAPAAALTVTSSVPGDGGNTQPRNRQPSFTFSSVLNAASVNAGNFALAAGALPEPSAIRVVDRVARLEPAARLLPQTTYTVRATPGIQDTFGQTLAEPVQRSFVTADASWKETLQLPFTGVPTGPEIAVAMDPKGNAWGAWTTEGSIFVNRYDVNTGAWNTSVIGGNSAFTIDGPQLAADGAGNAVVVWAQRYRYHAVYASRYTAATGTWETPRLVSSDSSNTHNSMARVVMRADGVITLAWRRAGAGVFVSTAGIDTQYGWSTPIRIDDPDTTTDNEVATLAVAVSPTPGGRAAIAWSTGHLFQNAEVWVSEFGGSAPWPFARPRRLSVAGSVNDRDVGVSVDIAGHVHVLWRHDETPSGGVGSMLQFAHFDGTRWSAPQLISSTLASFGGAAIATQTELGQQPATWVSWFGAGPRVMATRLRGTSVDTPQVVGVPPAASLNSNQRTALVVDRAGNVVVSWTSGTTSAEGRVMAARRVARLGAWQAVRTLEQMPIDFPFTPVLAANASGDVLVAWKAYFAEPAQPTTMPVYTKRFD